jgi:hypothetical protein
MVVLLYSGRSAVAPNGGLAVLPVVVELVDLDAEAGANTGL